MKTHVFQAIAAPKTASPVCCCAGTRRTLLKRLAALPLTRPFRVEVWEHTQELNYAEGHGPAITTRRRDIIIH